MAAAKDEDMGMPQMPVMPDPNAKFLWSGDPNVREFDFSKFVQIWPAYINSDLSYAQGRRIGKEHCCSDPIVSEMSEICQSLKLRHVIEPYKRYPRLFLKCGRIRVQIVDDSGNYCNEEIKSKKDLLKKMGTFIPKLNSRIKRQQQAVETAKQEAAQQQTQQITTATSSGNSKKKKGKKGRK
eukprot:CAMPEP_0185026338 /NCGR_PEP_ID=MMETSP1103-20130426/10338_1 /TAXON_ID=36769 /ORGANISM="Paraphysomonas bandaiensis, Strain Caron Lab Isolate" /LENGTH=181 /DNA_ID=CAMNT_0027559885 /DNA_START=50 /DNA_END=595 /DNA_ORIENTATION=-